MKNMKWLFPAMIASFVVGCQVENSPQDTVRLATTTSVQDTGLLDVLTDAFRKEGKYALKAIAVGSGQAMQLGMTGEADILWVHSPDDERLFMSEGCGAARITFMHNDFVILGPAADPAKVNGVRKAADAFKKIAAAKALFVSRGDKSGTHKKELKIWGAAEVRPAADKYIEAGQGMAATLTLANEKNAYILVDRSTWFSMEKKIGLVIVSEGDDALLNRYSLILVNPARFPKLNAGGARAFFDFMLSKPAKGMIEKFGRDKFGKQLFFYDYAAK